MKRRKTPKRKHPYEKIVEAYRKSKGVNLTAEDVDLLMSDQAVKDVIENWNDTNP